MKLVISASPHIDSGATTRKIMGDVLIALCPALIAAIVIFGWRALLVTAVCAAACVFFEWGFEWLCHKESTIGDLSAVVTGVILAYNLPVSIPLWQAVFGCLVAIVAVKQLFGGIGKNFANPALVGRIVLFLSFSKTMTAWVFPDAVSSATPLAQLAAGQKPELLTLLLGNHGGCIGETSALLLIIGFIYLLYRKVITARIPLAYIGTVAILAFLFPQGNDRIAWMAAQVFGGGLMLGAIFMATDYVTSPLTKLGQIVYGIGCGVITILIRYFGGYSEGVTYAILCMNACAVLLDKIGRPVKFGAPKKEAAKK